MQERKRTFVDTPFLKAAELPLLMLLALVVVFLLLKLTVYVMPLLIAMIISFSMEPLVRLLAGTDKKGNRMRKGLPRNLSIIIIMLIVFSLLLLALFLIVQGLTSELINLGQSLPTKFPHWMARINELISNLSVKLNLSSTANILSFIDSLGSQAMQSFNSFAAGAIASLAKLPCIILFVVFTIMSTYFLSSSRFSIMKNLKRQLPQSWQDISKRLYGTLIAALIGWFKAQLIIICCMFLVMLLGFSILHIQYALLLAAAIAIMDALPILGSGLVFIPWIGFHLFFGSLPLGIGLAVLYVCLIFTRQSIEPRIVGMQIGLPPLWTMCAMYAGFRLLGFIGLFIGPFTLLLMYNIAKMYLQNRTYREVLADVASQWAPPPGL